MGREKGVQRLLNLRETHIADLVLTTRLGQLWKKMQERRQSRKQDTTSRRHGFLLIAKLPIQTTGKDFSVACKHSGFVNPYGPWYKLAS